MSRLETVETPELSVLYDGGCGLCRREIAYYRRRDAAGKIQWVDITREQGKVKAFGVTPESAMARLHAVTAEGRLVTGAYAFAAIWARLPVWNRFARIVDTLRLLPALDYAYGHFAARRLRYRGFGSHCQISADRGIERRG